MQISEGNLKEWMQYWEHGDNKKIAELLDMNEATVSRILARKSETTLEVLVKVRRFFMKKKQLQESLNKGL